MCLCADQTDFSAIRAAAMPVIFAMGKSACANAEVLQTAKKLTRPQRMHRAWKMQ